MGESVVFLKTSTFKSCHIICQLGSAVDNVDGVKAKSFKNPLLGLAKARWERGISYESSNSKDDPLVTMLHN